MKAVSRDLIRSLSAANRKSRAQRLAIIAEATGIDRRLLLPALRHTQEIGYRVTLGLHFPIGFPQ